MIENKEVEKLRGAELAKNLFEILKKEGVSTHDFYVILLFLLVYKREIETGKSKNIEDYSSVFDIEDTVFFQENNNENSDIVDYFRPTLSILSKGGTNDIFKKLLSIDRDDFISDFSYLFDQVLYQIAKSQGKAAGEFIQPLEITRLICNLADIKSGSKVYNPFAGLASFATQFDDSQHYYGQELTRSTWLIGRLRLLAHGKIGQIKYTCEDSILNWPPASEKFDYILSNPPFGLRLSQEEEKSDFKYRTVEQFLLMKGIESLSSEGKLIAILPYSFLFKSGEDYQLRKKLIKEDLVDTIISFPGGLLANTAIPFVVLILNKAKEKPNTVRFIDTKYYVFSRFIRERRLYDLELIEDLQQEAVDDDVKRIIDVERIVLQNYNFSFNNYFVAEEIFILKERAKTFPLHDFLEVVKGEKTETPILGKLIRIKNLNDNKFDFTLDLSTIKKEGITIRNCRKIEESCLLISTTGRSIKPTYFQYKEKPIYVTQDILCFKIDESKVNLTYLINELYSDATLMQLDAKSVGTAVRKVSIKDLMAIVIDLPSMAEQVAKAKGILETASRVKLLEKERDALLKGHSSDQYNEFASLKHTLGRPRQNILDWSVNLIDFLGDKSDQIRDINKEFADFYEVDIFSALEEIKKEVSFITEILEKGENGLVVSDFEKTSISLTELNNFINSYASSGLGFKVVKQLLNSEDLKVRGIFANKVLLKTLIDNVLTNAGKHAFEDNSQGNEVVIALNEIDDYLVLEIKNNGKPFPNNFDKEKFISKYSTANKDRGTGLGGYDIHRIAKYFEDENWILDLNNDPIYNVKFMFHFPIKMIK